MCQFVSRYIGRRVLIYGCWSLLAVLLIVTKGFQQSGGNSVTSVKETGTLTRASVTSVKETGTLTRASVTSVKETGTLNRASGEKDPSFNRILVSSMKRSGSTFLGRAVGWSADSFYWFEPLMPDYNFQYFYANGTQCNFYTPKCKTFTKEKFNEQMATIFGNLEAIFNCNFTGLSGWVRRMNYFITHESQGPSWDVYRQCLEQHKHQESRVQLCLTQLVPVCKRAKNRVVKLLRMELALTSQLLTTFPDLKIVQLFRDPRGLLHSHIRTIWFPVSGNNMSQQREDMAVTCDRQRKDLTTAKNLLWRFPTRFKIVQYEDFDTFEKIQRLYQFVGMNFTEQTKQLLDGMAKGFGTAAGFHPFDYRNTLSWESVELANKYCADIYNELGIVPFQNKTDFQNNTIQSVSKVLPYAL